MNQSNYIELSRIEESVVAVQLLNLAEYND